MIHLPTLDMLSMHIDLSFATQEERADIFIWEYVGISRNMFEYVGQYANMQEYIRTCGGNL